MINSALRRLALVGFPDSFQVHTINIESESTEQEDKLSELWTSSEAGSMNQERPKVGNDESLTDVSGITREITADIPDVNSSNRRMLHRRRSAAAFPSFLHKLAETQLVEIAEDATWGSLTNTGSSSIQTSSDNSPHPCNASEPENNKRTRGQSTTGTQPTEDQGNSNPPKPPKRHSVSFSPNIYGLDESIAKKIEEAGRLRRIQSQRSQNTNPSSPAPLDPAIGSKLVGEPCSPGPLTPPLADDLHQKCKNDMQALQDVIDMQLAQLRASKEEADLLRAEYQRDKALLASKLKASVQNASKMEQENALSKQKISRLTMELNEATSSLKSLTKEKEGWQEQLDTMHHRVVQAERHVRCVDHLTRLKLEAHQEGAFGSVKRTKQMKPVTIASAEVIKAISSLNEEISQYANLLAENMQAYTVTNELDTTRSKKVIGETLTTSLVGNRRSSRIRLRLFLIQVVLEVFMVHWCTDIIEGWYPKQQSFADVLLDLSSQSTNSSIIFPGARVDHGKIKILQTDTAVDYSRWAVDIIKDLSQILALGAVRINPDCNNLFTSKFLTLVKMAYDVRTALAENDLCGGLELSVVGDGTPFQPRWMEEAHRMSRTISSTTMKMEPVAGTCALGLRRYIVGPVGSSASTQNPDMILRPKIILSRALEDGSPW